MTEQSWRLLLRAPKSTISRVLQSPAFIRSRQAAETIIDNPTELRELAKAVERLDQTYGPLSAIEDRVSAAVRLLRAHADQLDNAHWPVGDTHPPAAHTTAVPHRVTMAARERLVVAALHYLVTPDDLVPDFRPGGYIDDVLLLSWVFGAAVNELQPFLQES